MSQQSPRGPKKSDVLPEPAGEPTGELVERAHDNPSAGFSALYLRVAPALHAWAAVQYRTSGGNGVDPDDLIQEVFVRAMAKFAGFDQSKRPFRAWIFRIAKNVLLEAHRRRRETLVSPVEGSDSNALSLDRFPAAAASISRQVAENETVKQLIEFAETLTSGERELLLDCGLERRPLAEVAARNGLPTETVKKRWQRLRTHIRDSGPFDDLV